MRGLHRGCLGPLFKRLSKQSFDHGANVVMVFCNPATHASSSCLGAQGTNYLLSNCTYHAVVIRTTLLQESYLVHKYSYQVLAKSPRPPNARSDDFLAAPGTAPVAAAGLKLRRREHSNSTRKLVGDFGLSVSILDISLQSLFFCQCPYF